MKKVLVVLALVVFAMGMVISCDTDGITKQEQLNEQATGKGCDSSGGDKSGCEDD